MTAKEKKYGAIVSSHKYFLKQLDSLGLNRRYLGYFMLVEMMNVLINENRSGVISFSQTLYPRIAITFNKSPCTVERNIRNLIDKCWSEELMNKLNLKLINGQKPACLNFIYSVKNYIINQIM